MKKSEKETFGYYLNKYLTVYLPGQRGLSQNSIFSYRDTFSLLILFLKTEKKLSPEHLHMTFLTKELIIEFAGWLESNRGCSLTSRNQRFVIIRSFCRWLATENPEFLKLSEEIYGVKLKKAPKPEMSYLSTDAMKCLLSQPDSSTNDASRYFNGAGADNTEKSLCFIIRWRNDVREGMWVKYNDERYLITEVFEYDHKKRYMKLTAKRTEGVH